MDLEEEEPRVCFVLKRPLGNGGLQRQAWSVIAGLRAAGAGCALIAHARRAAGADQLRREEPPVTVIGTRSGALFYLRLFAHLLRRRRNYDLIHVHGCGREA